MKNITFDEFFALVSENHPELLCDTPYQQWHTDSDLCFLTGGCAVYWSVSNFQNGERSITCHVHELAADADFQTVCRTFYDKIKTEMPDSNYFYLYHKGPLNEELDRFYGWRVFVRSPAPVSKDPRVTDLTRADADEIARLCDRGAYSDYPNLSGYEFEADSFARWDFDFADEAGAVLLGLRIDGVLAGVASHSEQQPGNLGFLRELYVAPPFRRQGVGKALVETAISRLPDRTWVYQAARDNFQSIALAKSAGFTFYGAQLILA